MDIKPPGSSGFNAPILDPGPAGGGGVAGGGGAAGGGKFADVLGGGGPDAGRAGGAAQTPFSSPILDANLPAARPQRLDGVNRADGIQHRRVNAASSDLRAGGAGRHRMDVVGERAGVAPGAGGNVDPARGPVSFREVATDTLKAESKMDAMIEAARKGKSFSANELLALQFEVFRYSQTVEVISKTTEKVVGAIKQTLGTQV